jgi:hypothetical protein
MSTMAPVRPDFNDEHRIVVFDLGPTDPDERRAWDLEHGGGVVRLTTTQRNICELDPERYVHELPAGATVADHLIHS